MPAGVYAPAYIAQATGPFTGNVAFFYSSWDRRSRRLCQCGRRAWHLFCVERTQGGSHVAAPLLGGLIMLSLLRSLVLPFCLACLSAPASAGLIIQNNWQLTTANTHQSSDASASISPLSFTNLLSSTFATATADAKAYEDVFGGNNASANAVYAFDFMTTTPLVVSLSDRLVGSLFLGDADSAHVDTRVNLIDQVSNAVVASLPIRSHSKNGTAGTDSFDESTPFFLHSFLLAPGDYLLETGLNVSANATSGVGDDRMESAFSYTVGLVYEVPLPSSLLLMLAGLLSLGVHGIRRGGGALPAPAQA
jgi:hypothetical protein